MSNSAGQKGVMLCERPALDTSPGPKPFLPSSVPSGLEPLGLAPTYKVFPPSLAVKPASHIARHKAAVRSLEEEARVEAARAEQGRAAAAVKAEHVTAFGAHLRASILAGEDVAFWRPAQQAGAVLSSLEASKARTAAGGGGGGGGAAPSEAEEAAWRAAVAGADAFVESVVEEATRRAGEGRGGGGGGGESSGGGGNRSGAMVTFVDDLLRETAEVMAAAAASAGGGEAAGLRRDATAEASSSAAAAAATPRGGGGRKGAAAAGKPAWALSAGQVAALEESEEDELLRFTQELDFEAFVASLEDDAELQESVKAMRGADGKGPAPGEEKAWRRSLVQAMNHAAMRKVVAAGRTAGAAAAAAGGDDAASVAGASDGGNSRLSGAGRVRSEASAARRGAPASEAGAGAGAWDASTRASEDVARMDRSKVAAHEAADFLRENPELRAVHSPASVRVMIGRTEAGTAGGQ